MIGYNKLACNKYLLRKVFSISICNLQEYRIIIDILNVSHNSFPSPNIRQYNNIDLSSDVSTVHKFVYTDKALLLVRQYSFQPTTIQELEYINQTAHCVHKYLDR